MKENDFMILYVLVCGILVGCAIAGAITSGKSDEKHPGESVYDSRFHSFEWKDHKYLKYGNSSHPSVLHDPDCPCRTNRLEAGKCKGIKYQ